MDSLRQGEERACLPVQLGSFLSILQLWHILKKLYIPLPQCQRDMDMACVPTHLDTHSSHWQQVTLQVLFTHLQQHLLDIKLHTLLFGEELIHLSASDPSQAFHR